MPGDLDDIHNPFELHDAVLELREEEEKMDGRELDALGSNNVTHATQYFIVYSPELPIGAYSFTQLEVGGTVPKFNSEQEGIDWLHENEETLNAVLRKQGELPSDELGSAAMKYWVLPLRAHARSVTSRQTVTRMCAK